jgi:transcriptional regulator GlxA family with amidase domain
MDTGLVTMNPKELTRAAFMQRISEGRTTQAEVAQELRLSLRQFERLYAAYKRRCQSVGLEASWPRQQLSAL